MGGKRSKNEKGDEKGKRNKYEVVEEKGEKWSRYK